MSFGGLPPVYNSLVLRSGESDQTTDEWALRLTVIIEYYIT